MCHLIITSFTTTESLFPKKTPYFGKHVRVCVWNTGLTYKPLAALTAVTER